MYCMHPLTCMLYYVSPLSIVYHSSSVPISSLQCRSLRMVIEGKEKVPMQVDGEAWLQEPGVIMVTHKNKARMIVKDKVCV